MSIDKNYIYLLTNESSLLVYRHSQPEIFTPQLYTFTLPLPNITSFFPLSEGTPSQFLFLSDSNLLAVSPLKPLSGLLSCETYPKPDTYLVEVSAYVSSCIDALSSQSIIASPQSATLQSDFCIIRKSFQISISQDDEEAGSNGLVSQFFGVNRTVTAVLISLEAVLGIIIIGSVSYATYWKFKNGFERQRLNQQGRTQLESRAD
jgi:hypothetical protein